MNFWLTFIIIIIIIIIIMVDKRVSIKNTWCSY